MKGYYIEVTNNLLDTKHYEHMKESVWLFMWLLDKITSINEDGIGKVLGGKPITYKDVNEEIKMSRMTYWRYIQELKKHEYIRTLRAPTGLIISIMKAKKRFGSDVTKTKYQSKSDVTDVKHRCNRYDTSDVTDVKHPNKTGTIDNTIDNTIILPAPSAEGIGSEVNKIIELFKDVNPSYELLFKRIPQRKSMERLIKKYGEDKEKLIRTIQILKTTNSEPYFPTITTPIQLEENLGKLISKYRQRMNEKKINIINLDNI